MERTIVAGKRERISLCCQVFSTEENWNRRVMLQLITSCCSYQVSDGDCQGKTDGLPTECRTGVDVVGFGSYNDNITLK